MTSPEVDRIPPELNLNKGPTPNPGALRPRSGSAAGRLSGLGGGGASTSTSKRVTFSGHNSKGQGGGLANPDKRKNVHLRRAVGGSSLKKDENSHGNQNEPGGGGANSHRRALGHKQLRKRSYSFSESKAQNN